MTDVVKKPHYQFEHWHNKNSENFSKSFHKFPFGRANYKLNFDEDDPMRYGKLVKAKMGEVDIWLIEMPKNCQVYHASRSLIVNNAGFPIPTFSMGNSSAENRENEFKDAQTKVDCLNYPSRWETCATNTYYSSVPLYVYIKNSDTGYLGKQVSYSFGYDEYSDTTDTLPFSIYNDRNATVANYEKIGVLAYRTKKEKSYFLAMPGYTFTHRGFITQKNLAAIFGDNMLDFPSGILSAAGATLQANMKTINDDEDVAVNYLFVILMPMIEEIAKGLRENSLVYNNLGTIRFIYEAFLFKNFDLDGVLREIYKYGHVRGYRNVILESIYNGKNIIPGFRMSMFREDRPFHTYVRWKLTSNKILVNGSEVTVEGLADSPFFNPYFYTVPQVGSSSNNVPSGYFLPIDTHGLFHSEYILFFAPDTLELSTNNNISTYYKINSLGLLSELRKYKTSNILQEVCNDRGNCRWEGFHQGHLFEHSSWVGLNAISLARKLTDLKGFTDKDFIAGGALHDIGKGGGCKKQDEGWKDYNPHEIAKVYSCNIVSSGYNQLGFSFFDQPLHPEDGYSMLWGLKPFEVFNFKKRYEGEVIEASISHSLVKKDWDLYAKNNDLSEENMKYIRIATGAHWNLGPMIGIWANGTDEDKKLAVDLYIYKIQIFYNSEFPVFDTTTFKKALFFTFIISFADLLGAIYDPKISHSSENHVYNEIPNMSITNELIEMAAQTMIEFNRDPSIPVFLRKDARNRKISSLVKKIYENRENKKVQLYLKKSYVEFGKNLQKGLAMKMSAKNPPPKRYAKVIEDYFFLFYDACKSRIETYIINPLRNFVTMDNLMNGFDVNGIYRAYGDSRIVPKVLIFDLDGTLSLGTGITRNDILTADYNFVPEIRDILSLVSRIRKEYGVVVALATRHSTPTLLFREMQKETSPIYRDNFDIVVSQYTGNVSLISDMCNHLGLSKAECEDASEVCTEAGDDCVTGKYGLRLNPGDDAWKEGNYNPINSYFTNETKIPHMKEVLEKSELVRYQRVSQEKNVPEKGAEVQYRDMILFDNDEKYINTNEYLGGDVFTAGVPSTGFVGGRMKKVGLTMKLFHQAIALYAFQRLTENF